MGTRPELSGRPVKGIQACLSRLVRLVLAFLPGRRKAVASSLVTALCLICSQALAIQAGDVLLNKAFLNYNGSSIALEADSTVVVASSYVPPTMTLLGPDPAGSTYTFVAGACTPAAGIKPSPGTSGGYTPTILPGSVTASAAASIAIGDPVMISVTDASQNQSTTVVETIQVQVRDSGTGDFENVTLTETGPDTGVFLGYVYTTASATASNDCALSVATNSQVTVNYTGQSLASNLASQQPNPGLVSQNLAVGAVGLVFDDVTGQPIDGVVVTLVDANTGNPAGVVGYGSAYATYPSTVMSAAPASDASGRSYTVGPGQYQFPAVPAGDYRIVLLQTSAYVLSTKTDAQLQALSGSSVYSLSGASRGQVFHVSQGSLPRIDIPLHKATPQSVANTNSSMQVLEYSNLSGVGTAYTVEPSQCAGGSQNQITTLKGAQISIPGSVNLAPTDALMAGQPIFVKIDDPDQNQDPTVRESITTQLTVDTTGDTEWITLTETGVNSGVFIGYIQTAKGTTANTGNCVLSVTTNSVVTSSYTDPFNNTDVSQTRVLIDPYGKVFSSFDGAPVSGVTVTLIDDGTGAVATVYGDGPDFAAFPNPVVSGSTVTDAAGNTYQFPPGDFRFPFVMPGNYHFQVSTVPANYVYPSSIPDATLQQLPTAPYALGAGSRGGQFTVPLGPAVHLDIPLDRQAGDVFITLQASKQTAAIGDFVQFKATVQNRSTNLLSGGLVADTLPKGFRYRKGSLKIDGAPAPDPQIGADGRSMTITLPDLGTTSVDISYVTEITSGSMQGVSINSATVTGPLISTSNTATTSVNVSSDLFNRRAILTGRVTLGDCWSDDPDARGVKGVRLFLEDGTNVVTDDNGMWHIEGVSPGTHVVQLDTDSLPQRYQVSACKKHNRFAGTPYSQFVEVQGGTVWRADFKVSQKPLPVSKLSLTQVLKPVNDGIAVTITATNPGPVDVQDANIIYNAPKGWQIEPGSESLDGKPVSASRSIVGSVWKIDDLRDSHELKLKLVPADAQQRPVHYVPDQIFDFNANFAPGSARLTSADKKYLDKLAHTINQDDWESMTVTGFHTDPSSENKTLANARARAVADFLNIKVAIYPITVDHAKPIGERKNNIEIWLKAIQPPAPVVPGQLGGDSQVRLAFTSAGTPKGMTGVNKMPLAQLAGGFSKLSTSVTARAEGSWDLIDDNSMALLPPRSPNVQGLINIADGTRLSRPISPVKLDLDSRLQPKLILDGKEIPRDRIGFKMEQPATGKTLYSYVGVDFGDPGTHRLTLEGVDTFGNARFKQTVELVRVGELYRIKVLETKGNVADGTTPVKVKLALLDRKGERINVPYKLVMNSDDLNRFDKNMSLSQLTDIKNNDYVEVHGDGTLLFNPVNDSGVYHATLKYQDYEKQIQIYVKPQKRNWIMVGLAEGTAAYRMLSGNMQNLQDAKLADKYELDGRVAFYAKGQVKGQYILTAAYDTAKQKPAALGTQIDPNAYYTLYGDRTTTQYDASSQSKLYLKLEKDQFYALFGDYSTGLTETDLSKYARRFNGLKTEYEGKLIKVKAFAAKADQAFVKDELRGDGTSGLYRLSSQNIVANSESITIETRDRFHSEDVLDRQRLQRYLDYDIDYDKGTVFFKQPIYSQDTNFNPTYIVADYEVQGDGRNRINAGGRVAFKLKKNSEVGVTLVRQGVENRESSLAGADIHYQVSAATEVKAEVATTRSNDGTATVHGSAYLAEVTSQGSKLKGKAYIRQQGASFGLGQQSSSETGTRKAGVNAEYLASKSVKVKAEAYRQTNMSSDTTETVASSTVQYGGKQYQLSTGVRSATSDSTAGSRQVSNQLIAGGQYQMLHGKMGLSTTLNAPLGGKNGAANFPKKLRVGLNYKLSKDVTLKAEQELTWGEQQNTRAARVGMTSRLWKGATVSQQVEQTFDENSRRLASVSGLKQTWDVSSNLRVDFGVDSSKTVSGAAPAPTGGMPVPPLTVTTVYSSPGSNDFTSVTVGSRFRKDAWDWTTRMEYRTATDDSKFNLLSNVIHDLDEGQQLLAKVDIERSASSTADTRHTGIQLGYSYRPVDGRWTLFNKLDLAATRSRTANFDTDTQKIVNNLNANYLVDENTQISFQYGVKYVVDNFDLSPYHGFTDLYGVEIRHDLGERWDVGAQSSFYDSKNPGVGNKSYGFSFGYSIARNVWMSVGFNFKGFRDSDFSAANYTAKGVYLKYRLKFDQNSLRRD